MEHEASEVRGLFTRLYTVLATPPRTSLKKPTLPVPRQFRHAVKVNAQFTKELTHPDPLVAFILDSEQITVADNRMFTPVNMMKKEDRAGLVHQPSGEELVEIDTVAAHVSYFPSVLRKLGYGRNHAFWSIFKSGKPLPATELDLWKEWTSNGTFHQEVAARAGTSIGISKLVFNKIVNSTGRLGWTISRSWDGTTYMTAQGKEEARTYRIYKQLFPKMMQAAQTLRREQPGKMHSELTSIEGRIIRELLPRLAKNEGLYFADVHDGISCRSSHAPRLTQLFEGCTVAVIGHAIPVKLKAATPAVHRRSLYSHISGAAETTSRPSPFRQRWRRVFDELFPRLNHQHDAMFAAWIAQVKAECA